MNLSPMRYKDYVWPNNPYSYSISFRRPVAAHKVPRGRYAMEDLGMSYRVMEGEGEFAGEGAYREFQKLASVFYSGGAGVLVHPVWQTTRAYFVSLEVMQEPTADYVRYRFCFWEEWETAPALTAVKPAAAAEKTLRAEQYHTVARGDTLWAIASRSGMTLNALLALNPQIKNPNLIIVGEKVRIA
jgi:LysM repeat protein